MEIQQPIMESADSKICRICLRIVQNTLELFSAEKNSTEILKKIYVCFQLTLRYKEYFPSSICVTCIEDLNTAYNFRQNCETFEKRFNFLYQESITETNVHNTTHLCSDDYSKLDSKLGNDNIKLDEGILIRKYMLLLLDVISLKIYISNIYFFR